MKRRLFTLFILLSLTTVSLWAQSEAAPAKEGDTVTFTFAPGEDLFTLRGNEAQLARLSSLIDEHRDAITARRMPLYVDGYCASLPTPTENLRTAYLRASRVKSELITQKGLTEADFITANYATAYGERKDVVVVTLRLPAKEEPKPVEPVKEQPRQEEATPADTDDAAADTTHTAVIPVLNQVQDDTRDLPKQEADSSAREIAGQARNDMETARNDMKSADTDMKSADDGKPYTLALRTNLLYDAFLLPTLGIEWRINNNVGVKLDGSLSRWGGSTGKVQKVWMLSPEVRWYLLRDKRFYLGASGNYGEYNIYKYIIGNLMKDDTGYQGKLWSAGLTVGYQLRLCRHLSVDFNLGLGYTRSEYDSFTVTDGVRVSKQRNKSKNLWGPTQAGISLVWTIGGNNAARH